MNTYTVWSGYLPDHEFEDDDYYTDWEHATSTVLDALHEEQKHAEHEARCCNDFHEEQEWEKWAAIYELAGELLSELMFEGDYNFDITIRDERFAILKEDVPEDLPDADDEDEHA